jgi:nucleoside-diphosphate-sugar epimerase
MIWSTNSIGLTLLCLLCLGMSGVYTRRRFYMGRYKAVAVFQAVTAAFLIYGSLGYFFRSPPQFETSSFVAEATTEQRERITDFPRTALAISYVLTLGFLVGARTFIRIWHFIDHHPSAGTRVDGKKTDNHVLVVGGAGYIGSALVPQLLEAGYRVRVLDAMLFGEEPLGPISKHERLEIVRGDFQRSSTLATAMKDVGTVVHLAGIVGDPACNLDERLTIQVNLSSTRTIAEMAKVVGVRRFIFASTCSVYGACDEILDERSVAKPISLYGNTKLISEKVLHELADETFCPTILRFATIYGLSGRTRFDLVVNLLSAKAKVDGQITVFNGEQWRPFVHVVDAARAIKLVVGAPLEVVNDEVFNVGSNDQNHTILEIGEFVHQKVIGAELIVDSSGSDSRNYRVDFSKIRDVLGFESQWSVDDGIQQVLDAIASGQVQDYRDAKYSNFAFLNQQGTSELSQDHWAVEMIRGLEGV